MHLPADLYQFIEERLSTKKVLNDFDIIVLTTYKHVSSRRVRYQNPYKRCASLWRTLKMIESGVEGLMSSITTNNIIAASYTSHGRSSLEESHEHAQR